MLSAAAFSPRREPASVRWVGDVSQLDALFEPSVNVVVLERPLPADMSSHVHEACGILGSRPLLRALEPTRSGLEELAACLGTSALTHDVFRWVELFADITDANTVGLRLVQLTSAMCPRFHVDRMELRLVLTYRGPGTEFVEQAALEPHRARANDEIEAGAVQRAGTGDVVLLKGEVWPLNAGRGAVHRSPAATPGSPRLVLTLDVL